MDNTIQSDNDSKSAWPIPHDCLTAEEFLDYLQPRHPRWLSQDSYNSSWIFRGQRDATWKLIPSAMRTDWFADFKEINRPKFEALIGEYARGIELTYSAERLCELVTQIAAEEFAVDEFTRLADAVGHTIPLNHETLLSYNGYKFDSYCTRIEDYFKYKENIGSLGSNPIHIDWALAQHHRIPTRLLDWTTSPYTAAYFAIEDAFINGKKDGEALIAVWAVNYVDFPFKTDNKYGYLSGLHLTDHRRSSFEYLSAQSGLFMYDADADEYFLKHGYWRSFDEAFSHQCGDLAISLIRKVTLPVKEAKEALRLLAAERITLAKLMPSLDTVSKTLELNRKIMKR